MNKFLSFLICICSIAVFSQENRNYSKAKIHYNTAANYQKLIAAGIPMDHGLHKRGVFFISEFSAQELSTIKALGIEVTTLIKDSYTDFIQRNKQITPKNNATQPTSCTTTNTPIKQYPTPTNFSLGSMGGFLTYQEVLDNLDAMHSAYPSLISARAPIGNFRTNGTLNTSVTPSIGDNALQWVRISNNPTVDTDKPEILYDAIHHAREPAGLSQLIYYMWYLLENYDTDPEVRQIVDHTELYFVPVVNPDGYLYNQLIAPDGGGNWRKNRFNTHGVDLNRNYDHYTDGTSASSVWGGLGTSTFTNSDVYAGTGAFSEIETQAMKWFVAQHNFSIALNNHTFGDLLLYPYGYDADKPTPDHVIYQTISKAMVSENGFSNMISAGLYPAAGDSDDYMYGGTTQPHQKIFAFTPEIGQAFWPPANEIDGICKNMMHLNLSAAKMTHNYAHATDTTPYFIGETTTFAASYELRRLGISGNGNFTVTITPISANIIGTGAPKTYTNTAIGTTETDAISITLAADTPKGAKIAYAIEVNGGNIVSTTTVQKIFGALTPTINDNASSLTTYTHSGWSTTDIKYTSAPTAITDSPNGTYTSNQTTTIELSEAIDLRTANHAHIEFAAQWDIEKNWDYVQFQISTDNGQNWVAQCGKYTTLGMENTTQPTAEPLYDGSRTNWVQEYIDINEYLGETIKLRFLLKSDNRIEKDGFYFDDLVVYTSSTAILEVPEQQLRNFSIFPNPTQNTINILPSSNMTLFDIVITNILGTTIADRRNQSGIQSFPLSTVSTGIYFVTIKTGNTTQNFKILKN